MKSEKDTGKNTSNDTLQSNGSEEKYWGCFFCFIVFCIFAL